MKYGITNSVREFDCGLYLFHCECKSLQNVSPATWYRHSFKWSRSEARSKDELKDAMIMIRTRENGLKATGCNSVIEYSCPRTTETSWCWDGRETVASR